jgi:hypothetical protein
LVIYVAPQEEGMRKGTTFNDRGPDAVARIYWWEFNSTTIHINLRWQDNAAVRIQF